jgi:hypothetical protein
MLQRRTTAAVTSHQLPHGTRLKKASTQGSQHSSDRQYQELALKARGNFCLVPTCVLAGVALFHAVTTNIDQLLPLNKSEERYVSFQSSSGSHREICASVRIQTRMSRRPEPRAGAVWIPGYPGSGSEMLRQLLEAMTVLPADVPESNVTWVTAGNAYDDYPGNDQISTCLHAVTCKTHWPAFPIPHPYQFRKERLHQKFTSPGHVEPAILLLRHPLLAIPSYYNFRHETVNFTKGDTLISHFRQAPQQDWEKWRDERLDRQLQNWKRVIETWFNHADKKSSPPNLRFQVHYVIAYEHLTSHGNGEEYEKCFRHSPQKSETSRRQLGGIQSDACVGIMTLYDVALTLSGLGHNMIGSLSLSPDLSRTPTSSLSHKSPPLWIRCLWDQFVLRDKGKKKRQRSYEPTFTVQQYQKVCSTLQSLVNQPFHGETSANQLGSILREYMRKTPNCSVS